MGAAAFAGDRDAFYDALREEKYEVKKTKVATSVFAVNNAGIPSNADVDSTMSVQIAKGIATRLHAPVGPRLDGQTLGSEFERICADFVRKSFLRLGHLRPGKWQVYQVGSRSGMEQVAGFTQYAHLAYVQEVAQKDPKLSAALGNAYTIAPDVVVIREIEDDGVINDSVKLVDDTVALRAALRKSRLSNTGTPPPTILHASISCKWTMRSDRAQNSRSEALNFIRNRKGRLPHVVVVTAEPSPSRLGSLALGTGDIDCMYHFALNELEDTVKQLTAAATGAQRKRWVQANGILNTMLDGGRLKDISDLPLDLAV